MKNLNNNKKYFVSVILLFMFLSCKITKNNKSKIENCNCQSVVKAYVILNYRFENNDTLIGPQSDWDDGTFDENEQIDILKKVTALEINYTPIRRAIKGYYILKKTHLVHSENWIEKECPKMWKDIEYYKIKYNKKRVDKKNNKYG